MVHPILGPDWVLSGFFQHRPRFRVLQKKSGLKVLEGCPASSPIPTSQKRQGAYVPFFLGSFSCEPVRATVGTPTKRQAGHRSAREAF